MTAPIASACARVSGTACTGCGGPVAVVLLRETTALLDVCSHCRTSLLVPRRVLPVAERPRRLRDQIGGTARYAVCVSCGQRCYRRGVVCRACRKGEGDDIRLDVASL